MHFPSSSTFSTFFPLPFLHSFLLSSSLLSHNKHWMSSMCQASVCIGLNSGPPGGNFFFFHGKPSTIKYLSLDRTSWLVSVHVESSSCRVVILARLSYIAVTTVTDSWGLKKSLSPSQITVPGKYSESGEWGSALPSHGGTQVEARLLGVCHISPRTGGESLECGAGEHYGADLGQHT